MAKSVSVAQAIQSANSGKKIPVMSLVRDDAPLAAVISKLVTGMQKPTYDSRGNREPMAPNIGTMKTISDHTAQNITDSKTIMQIFPDMELSSQILVSSILSPKDMMATDLTFWVTEGLISPDVTAAMISRTTSYFEVDYKIKPLLQKILKATLFEEGSFPIAVIPENSLDNIINSNTSVTMESLNDTVDGQGNMVPIGLLGPSVRDTPTQARATSVLSLESLGSYSIPKQFDQRISFEGILNKPVDDHFVSVTDNYNLLKIPKVHQRIREQRIVDAIGSRAMESFGGAFGSSGHTKKINDREMSGLLYKERNFNYKPITALKTQEQLNRRTVGNPLILHIPAESVIPVYVPGCVEQHVGFFVLIDADGNPINKVDNADYYQQVSAQMNSNGNFPSAMMTRVKSMMSGFEVNNREHLDYSARAYGELVEQDLLARLRNGVYGNGVALAKKEEIYRIMFARALQKQHTQLLFIPVELMTYFAFRHNPSGIGVSLLEGMKVLNSLRAMLLFGNVMASLKNSIGRTEVKLKLDESDPNPQKTIEIAMHEIIRSRQHAFPLGINSPTDLVDWLQKSGFEFTFEGHPGIPDVSIDFGEKNTNYVKPDVDLEETLRKRSIMSVGLSPATVDATFEAEFASSVVTNNLLLSKRVMQIQEEFTPQLSEHMRKCMMNSEELINDLREILMANFDKLNPEVLNGARDVNNDYLGQQEYKKGGTYDDGQKQHIVNQFLYEYIYNFNCSLPKPNSVTLENQLSALETYSKALDVTLEAFLSEKFFTPGVVGKVTEQVVAVKEVMKAYFIRQWMNENGVMPELSKLTNTSEDDKPELDMFHIQGEHMKSMMKTLTKFMEGLKDVREIADKKIEALNLDAGAGGGGGGGSAGGFDFGGGSEGGAGGDFGSGDLSAGGDTDFGADINAGGGGGEPSMPGGTDELGGDNSNGESGSEGGAETPQTGNESNPDEEETPEQKKEREDAEAEKKQAEKDAGLEPPKT